MRRDATDASVQRRADEEKKGTKGKSREKQERSRRESQKEDFRVDRQNRPGSRPVHVPRP